METIDDIITKAIERHLVSNFGTSKTSFIAVMMEAVPFVAKRCLAAGVPLAEIDIKRMLMLMDKSAAEYIDFLSSESADRTFRTLDTVAESFGRIPYLAEIFEGAYADASRPSRDFSSTANTRAERDALKAGYINAQRALWSKFRRDLNRALLALDSRDTAKCAKKVLLPAN